MGGGYSLLEEKLGPSNTVIKAKRQIVLKKAEGEEDKYNVVNSRSFIRQSKSNFSKYVNQEMGGQGDRHAIMNRAKANLAYLEERMNKF